MRILISSVVCSAMALGAGKPSQSSALDRYISEAASHGGATATSPGSLYAASGRLGDLGRDMRAAQVDDLVTIVVADSASAVARGTTSASRKTSAKSSVGALAGPLRAAGPLANLASLAGEQDLKGQGETSRQSSLTTTLTARVTHVLPNGFLVLEGVKDVWVNSERQQVTVRGVIRWNDVGLANTVRSDRLGNLEIRVNGKGVVGDVIRRPNILYRILLGILPF